MSSLVPVHWKEGVELGEAGPQFVIDILQQLLLGHPLTDQPTDQIEVTRCPHCQLTSEVEFLVLGHHQYPVALTAVHLGEQPTNDLHGKFDSFGDVQD